MAKPALVENIDYTIENGNYVFTSSYLLGRGYCCGNGCRNCPYGTSQLRVISMVPSWTETLLACGAQVVGRTRFCVHPSQGVAKIPAVGGTKDWKLEKVSSLNADLILLDREENPLSMAEHSPAAYFATNVQSIEDVARELTLMSDKFLAAGDASVAQKLTKLSERWKAVESAPSRSFSPAELPGVKQWIRMPQAIGSVAYVIWKKPWMAASNGTFISSVLRKLGIEELATSSSSKYPEFIMESLPAGTTLLFSTEPYPFEREVEKLGDLGFASAIVDGESFSWFGLRALRFLEEALGIGK